MTEAQGGGRREAAAATVVQRIQPTRGWTVAAQRSINCTHPSCPRNGGPFLPFLRGRPAKWTRWLAGAAAIKSR